MESKNIKCKICHMHNYTNNDDLNPEIHEGFTVGRGKVMYWYMIWHSTGNVTVVTHGIPAQKRFIAGDTEITIHLKSH